MYVQSRLTSTALTEAGGGMVPRTFQHILATKGRLIGKALLLAIAKVTLANLGRRAWNFAKTKAGRRAAIDIDGVQVAYDPKTGIILSMDDWKKALVFAKKGYVEGVGSGESLLLRLTPKGARRATPVEFTLTKGGPTTTTVAGDKAS